MPNPEFSAGDYWCEFVGMRDDMTPNAGTPFLALTFRVLYEARNGEWAEVSPSGRMRDVRLFVTAKAEPYTMERLERVGWNGDFEHPEFATFENGCTVLECSINANGYEEWQFARGDQEHTPWEADERRRFAARYKQQAQRSTPPASAPTPPPSRPGPAQSAPEVADISDAEIPF